MPDQPIAAEPTKGTNEPKEGTPTPVDNDQVEKDLKGRAEASKKNRRKFSNEWKRNVELRMGYITGPSSGGLNIENDNQSEINPDWSLTKTKTANLYSQVPTVQGTHENKQYAAAVPPFMKALNYELGEKRANVGVAMEEVLNDTVNAAGIGFVMVGYAARFDKVDMPVEETINGPQGPIPTKSLPPEALQQLVAANVVHMQPVERVVSDKLFVSRGSPTDLLWPSEFTGSNFDDGDFIGRTGRTTWSEAVNEWKLKEEDKEKVLAGSGIKTEDNLRSEPDTMGLSEARNVTYDELYYWRYRVDPNEKSFKAIWKIVFVHGLDKAVVHEPWKGQKYDEQSRKYVGACKFPVRVLTLTYITDNPIPPSDSSAGRPQVNDLRRSRSQMFQNRERSMPLRWGNTDRLDPLIIAQIMRGTYQGIIPTQGDGSKVLGEIARASYPSEDMAFDQAAKADLMETWQIGPNQLGTTQPGKKTSAETNVTQQNFATRIGQERGRVAAFFLSICEVLAGWMALYSDFPTLTDQERQQMQQAWDQKHILHDLVLKIRPDSQVVLDTSQRLDRIFKFINMTVKSGFVNPKPLLIEAAELSGIDPSEVIIDPQPKKPDDPTISYRFSGKDDLMNVGVVSVMAKHNKLPGPEHLDAAKKFLHAVQDTSLPPEPPGGPEGPPAGPPGAPGPHPPGPGAPPGPPVEGAHKDWNLGGRVAKRSRDIGGG